ncbi:hypothetical protein NQ317_012057 [Molorchus minor]|uniref:Uncharacterized protein n=1 Tax=Molorchus minor TaxID=1323400 RepID=A0ABQ9K708_9CUCU|nr:hypothetical protein NQ317_012057 [Molorchus minor]
MYDHKHKTRLVNFTILRPGLRDPALPRTTTTAGRQLFIQFTSNTTVINDPLRYSKRYQRADKWGTVKHEEIYHGENQQAAVANESDRSESKRSSGFYDLQDAQLEYDKTRSLPNSVYIDTSSSEGEEEDEEFEDARAGLSDRSSTNINRDNSDTDMDLYVDVEMHNQKIESKNIDQNNSKFEYDVPRISFKFFDKDKPEEQQLEEEEKENAHEDDQNNYEPVTVKSEVKIVLSTPEEEYPPVEGQVDKEMPKSHPSEKFVSQTEIFVKSLENIPLIIKSAGSDPNLVTMREHDEDDPEDGYYKVPRNLKKTHRLSQSLTDFDIENIENIPPIQTQTSCRSSIEHISVSQVIVDSPENDDEQRRNSESMEYCKVRSRLPLRIRRPTFRKPKKAVDTWNNFRTKFNNLMQEHAAQQKVGAYTDKEKVSINLEEMYKNSKTKCKTLLQNTGKIFHKNNKRSQDSFDSEIGGANSEPTFMNNVSSERIPLKATDIVYQLNVSADSENTVMNGGCLGDLDNSKFDESDVSSDCKLSPEERKEDFDFTHIKSAFKKKLSLSEREFGKLSTIRSNTKVKNNKVCGQSQWAHISNMMHCTHSAPLMPEKSSRKYRLHHH